MRTFGRVHQDYLEKTIKLMKQRGYHKPSHEEAYVYERVNNDKTYREILDTALRLSMFEADEMMVPRNSQDFRIICKVNEYLVIDGIRKILTEKRGNVKNIVFWTDYEAKMYVKEKHATPLKMELKNGI